jgi:hypothetical protein
MESRAGIVERKVQGANKIGEHTKSILQKFTETQAEKASLPGVIASLDDFGSMAPTRYPSDAILEKLRSVSDTSKWSALSRFGPAPDAVIEYFDQEKTQRRRQKSTSRRVYVA